MTPDNRDGVVAGSFRDPSGFLFRRDGILYRQVNRSYREHYDHLLASGLYATLEKRNQLIAHTEVGLELARSDEAYKIIKPHQIDFISYPYEWSFSQLKDAALATLEIQKAAMAADMTLKDATAFNIQFWQGQPILIDTLSLQKYREGDPWIAYLQFCQHFLAPLLLMKYRDARLGPLSRLWIDGIPLDLASDLLPFRTKFRFSILSHIHLHSKSQKHFADKKIETNKTRVSRLGLSGVIDSLETTIRRLSWRPEHTEWGEYYDETNYSAEGLAHKETVVREYIGILKPETLWDLGGNVGRFSRIASDFGSRVVSLDLDPAAVELNYLETRRRNEKNLLPLVIDLTNPSPAVGWCHMERESFVNRGPVDAVMALALIHHLTIANNVPFGRIAEFFAATSRALIVEFVPKSDSQVAKLFVAREDIFADYCVERFEEEFCQVYDIVRCDEIVDSQRTLYLMRKR